MIDDYRLYLHHRWMEGCTNAAALTREIQQLGHRGDINTVRRHLRPYRTGTIPADAPLPQLTVRRVTDWIMRRPEQLTDTERKCLDEHSTAEAIRRRAPSSVTVSSTCVSDPPDFEVAVGGGTLGIRPVYLFHTQLRADTRRSSTSDWSGQRCSGAAP
ncbi:hypothetical protein PV396_09025 [Streptomyces sp. ME02-8801-2C]|uniref:hypothetical protein n=1 Tax=Streptomyces sp. ME02-8801-2C TaxID=3028680 RepID=UPI0029BDFF8E|nr:hypothetical protein [Streptomyces sp. ME02-8801-2C]MDX3452085.1 hypothetical protein [Streptomyces sp. ME02-8801-2C]